MNRAPNADHDSQHRRQRGFTLIELLVVVGIVAILAAIAVPVFLNQKARGYEAQVKSDVANIAKHVETAFADGAATVEREGSQLTDGTTGWPVSASTDVGWNAYGTQAGYCIIGWSDAGGKYTTDSPLVYDSLSGGVVAGATCGAVHGLPSGFLGGGYSAPAPPAVTNRMQLVYDLSLGCADRTITVPIDGTVNGTIDWGDGSEPEPLTVRPTHAFPAGETYTISVEGSFTRYGVATSAVAADNACLTAVPEWGPDTGVTSAESAFTNATNLRTVARPPASVTDMSRMFYEAHLFNDDISDWDVSNVTSMRSMFDGARAFNQPIGAWDVSKVSGQGMMYMFRGATRFNQPIGNWDISRITNTSYMFYRAADFNQPLDTWNMSTVNTAASMFAGAVAFNQPLGSWDTSNIGSMEGMFDGARSFNQPLATWDTGRVGNMSYMFRGAAAFDQPIGSWNTRYVRYMRSVFENATSFDQPLDTWNMQNVTAIDSMFANAATFNQPLGSWTFPYLNSMGGAFWHAAAFNQDLSSWVVPARVTSTNFDVGATAWALPRPAFAG